jgi:hypothetical protein
MIMMLRRPALVFALMFFYSKQCFGFVPQFSFVSYRLSAVFNERLNRDLDERSTRKAQGQGGGEMAAGAILGGLIGGPFGVLFGAQIGVYKVNLYGFFWNGLSFMFAYSLVLLIWNFSTRCQPWFKKRSE